MSSAVEKMLLANRIHVEKTNVVRKHELFALEYMSDYDIIRAYKHVYDENGNMDDLVAQKAGSRLLRSVVVQRVIDREECAYIAKKQLDKEMVVLQIQRVYSAAMRDRDYAAANGALDKLMKHLGLYDKHQKQKRYSADELVGIRRKLEENGVSFDAPTRPIPIENSVIEDISDAEVTKEEVTG